MVTDVDTSENRMSELKKKVNMIMKAIEERDCEIESLKNLIESRGVFESNHTHTIKNIDKGKVIMQEFSHKIRLQLQRILFSNCKR